MNPQPLVLFYHQVVRRPRPEHVFFRQSLTLDEFRVAMEFVKRHYCPLSADEAYAHWQTGRPFPARSVLVTFDDGFRNNLLAAEILHQLGMNATFFVLSQTIDSGFVPWYLQFAHVLTTHRRDSCTAPWGSVRLSDSLSYRRWLVAAKEHLLSSPPERREADLNQLAVALDSQAIDPADEDYQFLRTADLRRLRQLGMNVGGHSATHDNLTRCTEAELRREMLESADWLATASGGPIQDFSYPDGRYDQRVLAIARQRFRLAYTASCASTEADLWQIPRRGADDYRDVRRVLSWWYPWRRRVADIAKRALGFAVPPQFA